MKDVSILFCNYYEFVSLAIYTSEDELYDKVKNVCKLWVNEGYTFGEEYRDFIRINIATQRSRLEELVSRLRKICD